MILNKQTFEYDTFLTVNNDIYRIMTALNKEQALKRLLVYTTKKPLEETKEQPDITTDLRDTHISRCPILPYNEDDGSIVVITLISGDVENKANTLHSNLAIDVFTPGNQWIINEGIRPLNICHIVQNVMAHKLVQTDGVKYRLTDIVNAQLSDVLVGYRMIFESVIDD